MKPTFLAALALLFAGPQALEAAPTSTSTSSSAVPKAQYGPWRSVHIGGGGYVQNVVATRNPRVFYAYIDVGGLYRSEDGGRSWKMLHGALPPTISSYQVRGMSADPRDENNIIALCGSQWEAGQGGVWQSRDGGKSWRRVLQAPFMGNGDDRWTGVLVARDARNPSRILVASEGAGVWQSRDGASTWSKIALPALDNLHPTDLKMDARGRAWLCAQPYKGRVDGREVELKGGFFASIDGGASWRKVAEQAPTEMGVAPWDGSLIGIFERSNLRQSRDAGATWSEFSQGLPQLKAGESPGYTDERVFQSLASGPDFWVTASTRGIFYRRGKSDTSWKQIERASISETYEGAPWISRMGVGWGQHFGSALASVVIDPRDSQSWFFTDWYAIYHSPDAGRNWNLSMDGLEDTVLHTLAQDAGDAGVVHLGMADNGYLWSDNGGVRFDSPHQQSNMKGLALSPASPNRVYGVGDPGNGQWKSNTVWVSIDRGHHWQAAPSKGLPDAEQFNRNSIAVDSRNALRVWVSMAGEVKEGAGGVYQSDDGAANWRWIGAGLPTGKYFTSDIWGIGRELAVASDGTLLAASRDTGALYFRRPNSATWEKSGTDIGGAWCVFASPDGSVWAASGASGVWQSMDGGASWAQRSKADAHDVSVDLAHPERIAIGCADGVRLSVDGGTSWSEPSAEFPQKNFPLVAFAGERLLAGTSGSGAFWMPLSPRGAQPVAARPIAPATLPGERAFAIALRNAGMEEGADSPSAWSLWRGEGEVQAVRDTKIFHGGKSALRLEAKAGYGSVSQVLAGAGAGAGFKIRGWARIEPGVGGNISESLLAVRGVDEKGAQVSWQTVLDAAPLRAGEWHRFEQSIDLPAATQSATLTLTVRGSGRVWLDDVEIEATPRVFPAL